MKVWSKDMSAEEVAERRTGLFLLALGRRLTVERNRPFQEAHKREQQKLRDAEELRRQLHAAAIAEGKRVAAEERQRAKELSLERLDLGLQSQVRTWPRVKDQDPRDLDGCEDLRGIGYSLDDAEFIGRINLMSEWWSMPGWRRRRGPTCSALPGDQCLGNVWQGRRSKVAPHNARKRS